MNVGTVALLILSGAIGLYLTYVMIRPERF